MKPYISLLFFVFNFPFYLHSSELCRLKHTESEWHIIDKNLLSVEKQLQAIRQSSLEYASERIQHSSNQQYANDDVCARKFRNLFGQIKELQNTHHEIEINMQKALGFVVERREQITAKNIGTLTENLLAIAKE